MTWSWPWITRALWNPVDALDLRDNNDNPDHSKIVPFILLVVAMVFHAAGQPFTWWELTTLGSLAYGYGAWRTFLKARSVTGTFQEKKEEIIQRVFVSKERDPEAGIDPTAE